MLIAKLGWILRRMQACMHASATNACMHAPACMQASNHASTTNACMHARSYQCTCAVRMLTPPFSAPDGHPQEHCPAASSKCQCNSSVLIQSTCVPYGSKQLPTNICSAWHAANPLAEACTAPRDTSLQAPAHRSCLTSTKSRLTDAATSASRCLVGSAAGLFTCSCCSTCTGAAGSFARAKGGSKDCGADRTRADARRATAC